MKVNYIGSVSADHFTESFLPLFEESVPVGFPSPANDYLEAPIDLNKYLIKNQVATFLVRAVGDSMIGAIFIKFGLAPAIIVIIFTL